MKIKGRVKLYGTYFAAAIAFAVLIGLAVNACR